MAKEIERKRKLEEQAENTPKRLKPLQADSAKKASGRGNASPQVQVSRQDGMKVEVEENSVEIAPSVTTPSAKKVSKKSRKSDAESTPAETPSAKSNTLKPSAATPIKKESKETMLDDEQSNALTRIRSKEEKKQRSREKKARRKAKRDVKAGVKEDDELTAPNEHGWWLSPPSAGRFLDHDPIFVRDGNGDECLIAATVREVQLLHVDSSLISRTHVVPDGRAVQCFSLSARYPDHVEVAYDNGAKVQWNWTTGGTTESTYPGHESVVVSTTAQLSDGTPEAFYIAHAQGSYNINGGRKLLYSTYRPIRSIQVLQNASFIVCFGTTVLLLGRRKEQSDSYVWIEMPLTIPPQCIDARAIYPVSKKGKMLQPELILAMGNADGKICLYSDLSSLFGTPSNATLPTPRILHWHREPVSTVKFSRDGNYLISGGRESVLVIWQLETGHKQFLPHLTAEVERVVVSSDGTRYALQMGDNSIMILSTTELKPVANFAGLQLPVQTEISQAYGVEMPATTAVIHPKDPTQLLLTVPSTQPKTARDTATRPFLQTFDIRNARHISRQALSRNNVTDFNLGPENTPILPPDVSQLAISADGNWLATVDEWIVPGSDLVHAIPKTTALGPDDILELKEQQERRREVYLKFWKWNEAQDIWTLSTRADGPHDRAANADLGAGAGSVLQLKADPTSNGFATIGQDGAVKLWRPRTKYRNGVPVREEDGSDFVEWTCRKTVTLPVTAEVDDDHADSAIEMPDESENEVRKEQFMALTEQPDRSLSVVDAALAFSPDGSMIACSTTTAEEPMHPLVHFINPATGAVTATKSGIMPSDQDVRDFGFLDRYLIILTYGSIRVWNLVDDSHHYTITLQGLPDDQQDAKLAINQTDETFAVVSSVPSEEDAELLPHIAVYSPKKPDVLFEADLESIPTALLSGNGARGYTILFEDGTIRSLSSAVPTSKDRRLSLALDGSEFDAPVEVEDVSSISALTLLKDEDEMQFATTQLTIRDAEDDRSVVRPEQLASIFDVGSSFAMPPVRDMFQAVVGLYARKPRTVVDADAMELA